MASCGLARVGSSRGRLIGCAFGALGRDIGDGFELGAGERTLGVIDRSLSRPLGPLPSLLCAAGRVWIYIVAILADARTSLVMPRHPGSQFVPWQGSMEASEFREAYALHWWWVLPRRAPSK